MEENKVYLGDGLYVHHDGYHIVLATSNGITTTNTVFLDPDVLAALLKYVALYIQPVVK